MKITIESTSQLTRLNGVPCRVWCGRSEGGINCFVFVHRVAVRDTDRLDEFERELMSQLPPGTYVPLSQVL